MTEEYEKIQNDLRRHYTQEMLKIVKFPGRWLTYFERTPYLVDVNTSLAKLEKLVREIK